jgi:uncharacterized protein YqjF (DUF2071 family)
MPAGFNHDIVVETAHRPWPMPDRPWVMTQTWNDLLFAHWPVNTSVLRELVPKGFELDLFDGQAFVGVVPFHMTNVAPRMVPALPRISAFPELNVRTYVQVGGKPGVYFFSLDAGSFAAVITARKLLNLPYFTAKMTVDVRDGYVRYTSRRASAPPAEFSAKYRGLGDRRAPRRGTLEYFLTERYCLYAIDHTHHAYRLEIHHPPWPLETGEAEIGVNTMADAAGIRLPDMTPLLHFSKRQDMVCWQPHRIG